MCWMAQVRVAMVFFFFFGLKEPLPLVRWVYFIFTSYQTEACKTDSAA